ncbi:hypothetical protein DXG03_000760 [Asterophora parasitica]|uniref:Uncharacterized protein n=1 Tax=Asterophora parasitica TaxID=117018 RepID=A0A9P7GD90_9AGAR|nr:hypothetical protein DXG03_000760 [Asterophora parasitica]
MTSTWTPRRTVYPRIFERPLGITEHGFYWDSRFNGTADVLQHAVVEILGPTNQTIFDVENVTRTWQSLKQQFPLLGSRMEESISGDSVSFVVAEDQLENCGPGEISFHSVHSMSEAHEFADDVVNGERLLSNDLLARIVILSRTDQKSHVALTRVLCRKYILGDIDSKEWEYRKREPMVTGGPLSLRPFLDREWYDKGGATNVSLAIGFFFLRLSFMPLGSAANLAPGDDLPSFTDLLSFPRFLLRSRSIRQQSANLTKHPLFVHISMARSQASIDRLKDVATSWPAKQGQLAAQIPVTEQGLVLSHGGSSMGNIDSLLPRNYPIAGASPILFLVTSGTKLHCRPTELYLGATTTRQQLHLHVFWDQNVYDDELVKVWLHEVREATEVYLGGDIDTGSLKKPQIRL